MKATDCWGDRRWNRLERGQKGDGTEDKGEGGKKKGREEKRKERKEGGKKKGREEKREGKKGRKTSSLRSTSLHL